MAETGTESDEEQGPYLKFTRVLARAWFVSTGHTPTTPFKPGILKILTNSGTNQKSTQLDDVEI